MWWKQDNSRDLFFICEFLRLERSFISSGRDSSVSSGQSWVPIQGFYYPIFCSGSILWAVGYGHAVSVRRCLHNTWSLSLTFEANGCIEMEWRTVTITLLSSSLIWTDTWWPWSYCSILDLRLGLYIAATLSIHLSRAPYKVTSEQRYLLGWKKTSCLSVLNLLIWMSVPIASQIMVAGLGQKMSET